MLMYPPLFVLTTYHLCSNLYSAECCHIRQHKIKNRGRNNLHFNFPRIVPSSAFVVVVVVVESSKLIQSRVLKNRVGKNWFTVGASLLPSSCLTRLDVYQRTKRMKTVISWRTTMAAGQLFWMLHIFWVGSGGGVMGSVAPPRDLSQHQQRDLQSTSRLWDISEPVLGTSGMQLDLTHTVRDQVRTSYVRIDLFRDEACSIPIDAGSNNYLAVDVVNDLTAFGDGSGTRQVCFVYWLLKSRYK